MNSGREPLPPLRAVKTNPDVIFRRLGEDVVLFHLGTDRFYELNKTAARFWELLSQGLDYSEVRVRMLDEFAVSPEQWDREAANLIDPLRREDLIAVEE